MNFVAFVLLFAISVVLACKNYRKTWNPFENQKPHLTALILARSGSKGIPLKNLSKIGNHSLLKNTLITIKQTKKQFSSIWVSTDHDLIIQEASQEIGVNIHLRSRESASDEASSILAVQEFLEKHPEIDEIALIQCTSPFIKLAYLREAINKFRFNKKCIFSVSRSFKLRWRENSDALIPVNFDPKNRPRRQDWRGELVENGMFYFTLRKFVKDGFFQIENE